MAELVLGHRRPSLVVKIYTESRFYQSLEYPVTGSNWPGAYVVTLEFGDATTWTATLSGRLATFDVAKTTVNAMADNTAVSLWLATDGTHKYLWASGVVQKDTV